MIGGLYETLPSDNLLENPLTLTVTGKSDPTPGEKVHLMKDEFRIKMLHNDRSTKTRTFAVTPPNSWPYIRNIPPSVEQSIVP